MTFPIIDVTIDLSLSTLTQLKDFSMEQQQTTSLIPHYNIQEELEQSKITSQMEALYYLFRGDNVLLCGSAGTGKSWVINKFREVITNFHQEYCEFTVATTASTGVAALLLNGQTIHSWSGLKIQKGPFDRSTIYKIMEKENRGWEAFVKPKLVNVDCLIIDEISMLPSYFLTNLDLLLRVVRKSEEAFGGVQIVFVGDFLQLPPVVKKGEKNLLGQPLDGSYCYLAKDERGVNIFEKCHLKYCYLDKSVRSQDNKLTYLLNAIRNENIDPIAIEYLDSRFIPEPPKKTYMKLFTLNKNTDQYNLKCLAELPGEEQVYKVEYDKSDEDAVKLVKQLKLTDLHLKVGATVMLTSNNAVPDPFCVNGSIGVVTKLGKESALVRFNDGLEREIPRIVRKTKEQRVVFNFETQQYEFIDDNDDTSKIKYIPLKLAWAITVHKSQGQTFDGVSINLNQAFVPGLGYVALSRAKTLDSIVLAGSYSYLSPKALAIDPQAKKITDEIIEKAKACRKEFLEKDVNNEDPTLTLFYKAIGTDENVTKLIEARSRFCPKPKQQPKEPSYHYSRSNYRYNRNYNYRRRGW